MNITLGVPGRRADKTLSCLKLHPWQTVNRQIIRSRYTLELKWVFNTGRFKEVLKTRGYRESVWISTA
jgi:hypothetical protein